MSDSANPNRNEADHQKADTLDSSFLSGANATFIAEMSEAWRRNPRAVDASDQRAPASFEMRRNVSPSSAESGTPQTIEPSV